MTTAVWKFCLSLKRQLQLVDMPVGAKVVHVHEQRHESWSWVCMWAEVDPNAPPVTRMFGIFATGQPIDFPVFRYIGTAHIDWTVWHVYEAVQDA